VSTDILSRCVVAVIHESRINGVCSDLARMSDISGMLGGRQGFVAAREVYLVSGAGMDLVEVSIGSAMAVHVHFAATFI
jgi:hypothetical protein